MLELRPNCELCDKDLPADSTEACICTYECTFCRDCVESVLLNVCPNCGGGFCARPIRPREARREGVSLSHQPATVERTLTRFTRDEIEEFAAGIQHIPAANR
ncbi:MAG: DUF1272 domain-containing protein [Pseudomonadota bacterium]